MISQLNVNDCHNELNTGQCNKREDIKKQRKKNGTHRIYNIFTLYFSNIKERKKKKKVLFDIITTFDLFTLTVFFALNYCWLHLMDFLSFIISLAFPLKECFVGV